MRCSTQGSCFHAGLINTNCVVEAEKMHYCFGRDDIYRHDGNSKQSIADEKVKNFVFGSLNNNQSDVCFVLHNEALNEIYFCYQSGDQFTGFPNANRCNRAARRLQLPLWRTMELL